MKRILVVFPNAWDRRQLATCREAWGERYELVYADPAEDAWPWDFDVHGFIERTVERHAGRVDGVMSSSDYPGATCAAAIAARLGLPGADPESVIRASHKYYSRLAQREAAPEATPWFRLVDPRSKGPLPDLEYPCFIKPVKGTYSVMSRRLDAPADLCAFLARRAAREFTHGYMQVFNRLVASLTRFPVNGSWFLAEELLHGAQVTVEGYVRDGAATILGIVDSVLHPETRSFARFDLPSALPAEVQESMADVARRVVARLGLGECFFNIEMIWEPAEDRVRIIEVNPRICPQFGDLYAKVLGRSSYEIALALAAGDPLPCREGRGPCALAVSFPLRTFRALRVLEAPAACDVAAAEGLFPGTLVWVECASGALLDDFDWEDGSSVRYAIVNLGADSRRELLARRNAVVERLGFRFAPV